MAQPKTKIKRRVERATAHVGIHQVLALFNLPGGDPGASWKVNCAFHDDEHPSAKIYGDGAYYKCFGCGVHGDVVEIAKRITEAPMMPVLELLEKHFCLNQYPLPLLEIPSEYWQLKKDCEDAVYHYGKMIRRSFCQPKLLYLDIVIEDLWNGYWEMLQFENNGFMPTDEHKGRIRAWLCHAKYTLLWWENHAKIENCRKKAYYK